MYPNVQFIPSLDYRVSAFIYSQAFINGSLWTCVIVSIGIFLSVIRTHMHARANTSKFIDIGKIRPQSSKFQSKELETSLPVIGDADVEMQCVETCFVVCLEMWCGALCGVLITFGFKGQRITILALPQSCFDLELFAVVIRRDVCVINFLACFPPCIGAYALLNDIVNNKISKLDRPHLFTDFQLDEVGLCNRTKCKFTIEKFVKLKRRAN